MRNVFTILAMGLMTSVFAQGTTPETKGEILTFETMQGKYAKSLLNTHFDENGVFQYVKPEDAKNADGRSNKCKKQGSCYASLRINLEILAGFKKKHFPCTNSCERY